MFSWIYNTMGHAPVRIEVVFKKVPSSAAGTKWLDVKQTIRSIPGARMIWGWTNSDDFWIDFWPEKCSETLGCTFWWLDLWANSDGPVKIHRCRRRSTCCSWPAGRWCDLSGHFRNKIWPEIWYVYVPPSVGSWVIAIDPHVFSWNNQFFIEVLSQSNPILFMASLVPLGEKTQVS